MIKKTILIVLFLLLGVLVGLSIGFALYNGDIEITTFGSLAEDFCKKHNLEFDGQVSGIGLCVNVTDSHIVDRKVISYVDSLKDWRFSE